MTGVTAKLVQSRLQPGTLSAACYTICAPSLNFVWPAAATATARSACFVKAESPVALSTFFFLGLFDCFFPCALGPVVLTQPPQHGEHETLQPIGQNLGLEAPPKQPCQALLGDDLLQPQAIKVRFPVCSGAVCGPKPCDHVAAMWSHGSA